MDIRGTFFKEDAQKWINVVEVDRVYTFSGGRLEVANPQWNKCKCQHEITFDRSTDIVLCEEDASIQQNIFEFSRSRSSSRWSLIPSWTSLVSSRPFPVSTITKKSGQELAKCELTVMDDSESQINVTLWGDKARSAENDYAGCPVTAFKGLSCQIMEDAPAALSCPLPSSRGKNSSQRFLRSWPKPL